MLIKEVMKLHRLGWCLLPMWPKTKKTSLDTWKEYQTRRPTDMEVREWFKGKKGAGMAVLLGAVSGNLVCRDFDQLDAYEAWARSFPELAKSLPQSETARGRHVFFRTNAEAVHRISKSGNSIVVFRDGELRGGGLAMLPPSVHPTGHVYKWLIAPTDNIPVIDDLVAAGLAQAWASESDAPPGSISFTDEDVKTEREPKRTELRTNEDGCHSRSSFKTSNFENIPLKPEYQALISATLPQGEGQRNKALFELARRLKGVPELFDADPRGLREYVKEWHQLALPVINTKSFEESFADFLRGWQKVKFPAGAKPLEGLFAEAIASPLPACAGKYETPKVQQLVALCRRLQTAWHPLPFPLACRSAAGVLGVSHVTANDWLFVLCADGVIREMEKGSQKTKRASRFQYLGD